MKRKWIQNLGDTYLELGKGKGMGNGKGYLFSGRIPKLGDTFLGQGKGKGRGRGNGKGYLFSRGKPFLSWMFLEQGNGFLGKKSPLNLRLTGGKKKLGGDLLSHTLACSTIGDEGLDF